MVAEASTAQLPLPLKVLAVVAIQEFSWMPRKLNRSLLLVVAVVLRPVRMLRVCQVVVAESEPHQQLQAANRAALELYLQAARQRLMQVARHQRQVRHT
jgi:hypothetical protein